MSLLVGCGSDSSETENPAGTTGGSSDTGGAAGSAGQAAGAAGAKAGTGGTTAGSGGSTAGAGGSKAGAGGTTAGAGGSTAGAGGQAAGAGGTTAGAGGDTAGSGGQAAGGDTQAGAGGTTAGAGGDTAGGSGGTAAGAGGDTQAGAGGDVAGGSGGDTQAGAGGDTAGGAGGDTQAGAGGDTQAGAGGSVAGAGGVAQGGAGAGGAGAAGAAGAASPEAVAKIGAECATNADCGDGGTCLTSSGTQFLGGGAPHGSCTIDCTSYLKAAAGQQPPNLPAQYPCDPTVNPNDPGATVGALCQNFGTDSVPQGYCSALCSFGSPAGGSALDPTKCGGRDDTTCYPVTAADGTAAYSYCRPFCQSDAQCDSGSHCDEVSGLCVKGAGTVLKKNGDACTYTQDPNAPQECQGYCVARYDQNDPNVPAAKKNHGFCIDPCENSSPAACGGTSKGYCLYNIFAPYTDATQSTFTPISPGDIGGCVEVAKPGDDASCLPADAIFTYTFVSAGVTVCLIADPCTKDTDCASGLTCKASKAAGGSFCVDHVPAL